MTDELQHALESRKNEASKNSKTATFSQEAKLAAFSDLSFVLLPFIVIVIVLAFTGRIHELFYISEWSIATPVVAGQAIARIVGVAANRAVVREGIVFLSTLSIVLLLVPSLVVLGFVLEAPHVTKGMASTQIVLFTVTVVLAFLLNCTLFDVEHGTDPNKPPALALPHTK